MKALDAALYAHLATTATTLYSLVGAKVYHLQAPEGAGMPYVVYNVAAGGEVNDNPQDSVNVRYLVKGLATTLSSAQSVDDAVATRLHNVSVTASGWNCVSSMREDDVAYTEIVNGAVVFHVGAYYRLRFAKA